MGRHHDKRAIKVRRRERRRQQDQDRKQRQNEREPTVFFGVEDGAPDDQLDPKRGPDAWHTVGVVIAHNIGNVRSFCRDIVVHAGHPRFRLGKWNGPPKNSRQPIQASFVHGFTEAIRTRHDVQVYVYAIQAKDIEKLWASFIPSNRIDSWAQLVKRADGKEVVHWGPIQTLRDGQPILVDFEMDQKRAAVLAWTALALKSLYEAATQSFGHKPRWNLLCDRLPADTSGRGIAVLGKLLSFVAGDRVTIHTKRQNDHTPDGDEELLADCVATWAKDFLEHPDRQTAKGLQAIFDDPVLTERFHLNRRRISDSSETPTATGVAPSPR